MIKIPRLGSYVYVITRDPFGSLDHCSIKKTKVLAKGQQLFFTELTLNEIYTEEAKRPLKYNEYGEFWFTKFSDAKTKIGTMKCREGYKYEIKKCHAGKEFWWNIYLVRKNNND